MITNNQKNIEVSLMKEGILHIHLVANSEITLNDAALAVEEMGKLSKGKKLPVFIDVGEFCTIDKEVRLFSASKESNLYTMADAIAYKNLGQKLITNFYIKENKPSVPTQGFSDSKEAILWLQRFLENKDFRLQNN
jgi:hypothetical protein